MAQPCSWVVIACIVAAASGCDTLSCGPGTKQVQQANGDVRCVAADAVAPLSCGGDGGVRLVAGRCVAETTCGPGTVAQPAADGSIVCVPSGKSGCAPPCSAPAPGRLCVDGEVRHLVDGSPLAAGERVHVALYEPLGFLADASVTPLAETDTDCGYAFADVAAPSSSLLIVAVSDAGLRGLLTVTNQLTGTGAAVVAQQSYRIDAYALPKSLVQSWSAAAGTDYAASGAVVARYFGDAAPPPTDLEADETEPVAGVTLTLDGARADGNGGHALAHYFGDSLGELMPSLTATGASGGAIVAARVAGGFPTLSGTGGTGKSGPITWAMVPSGSTAQVIFVERLHPM